MKFEIKNRFSGAVQFTADIDADEDTPNSVKIGLAVKWGINADTNLADANLADTNLAGANLADAYLADANLAGANLADAYLVRANLADANLARANLAGANLADAYLVGANLARANLAEAYLAGAHLVDGGQDERGYRFVGWLHKDDGLMILAGCRSFTLAEAKAHWGAKEYSGPRTNINRVDMIEMEAAARGWLDAKAA